MKFTKVLDFGGSRAARQILVVSGLAAVAIAGTILVAPATFYAGYGIDLGDNVALTNELKAPAGMLLVAGALMLAGVFRPDMVRVSLTTAAAVYLTYGLARLVSMVMDGIPNSGLVSAAGFELTIGTVCLLALLNVRNTNADQETDEEMMMKHNNVRETTNTGVTLVIGGTGKTGRRVAGRLQERGIETRIVSRSGEVSFDWNDPETWNAALDGVHAAYISYAPDLAIPGATDSIRAFVEQAVASGVTRFVLLSGRGEEEAQACERIVQESGVDWTVVRASWFTQNFSEGEFLEMVLDGAITLPATDVAEPFVDANDIADVAVAALTESGHAGEIYELTGPRLLTFADVAREISEAAGRDVQFVEIPAEAFASAVAKSGAPAEIAWLLNYLFETVLDGRNAYLTDGVQRALGRPPKDFSDYAREIAATGVWRAAA
jgi:uncharacterized protein YbjT (DUF2867 family)